ncbi:Lipase class 3 family protein [Spironucleus salmonicida]|uniref:Lipase class 3 family protein n=1 Tax=Spironucleus salmonicida TaxID=348837 RepID=V6M078_9EUKA|nr:Lipase class 3 family protein [Spironucleus salmonicida]|eukprot:EST46534.1 Lipase class 3 family protein [Spironucleus salmonicida]
METVNNLLENETSFNKSAQKLVFNTFYIEFKRQLYLAGQTTFSFVMMLLIFMFQHLECYKYGEHYQFYQKLEDNDQIKEIVRSIRVSVDFNELQQQQMSKQQSVTPQTYLKLLIRDKFIEKTNFVSLSEKQVAYWKYQEFKDTIILDYDQMSTFRTPSFFVSEANKTYTVVIRASTNFNDAYTTLDFTPEYHYGYYFHSGFFAAASYVMQILKKTLDQNKDIKIIGYSIGASISVILTYLLRLQKYNATTINCGQCIVGDYNFSMLAKSFSTTILNGFDYLPQFSFHAQAVTLMRMRLSMLKLKNKSSDVKQSVDDFDNDTIIQSDEKNFQLCEQYFIAQIGYLPEIRILSQRLTRKTDLFIAGNVFQFMKGNLVQVSVHDIQEFYFTIQGVLDHVGYHALIADLAKFI